MCRLSEAFDRRNQDFVGNADLNKAASFVCTWSLAASGAHFFILLYSSRAPPHFPSQLLVLKWKGEYL